MSFEKVSYFLQDFDDQSRELKYDLVAPEGFSGFVELVGSANFGGTEVSVTGDTKVGIGNIPQPPVFLSGPQSVSVVEGERVLLFGELAGTPPLTFQWIKEGSPVPGATEAALLMEPSSPEQSGLYRLVASNALGSATSDAALVVIEPKPPEPTGPLAIAVDSPFLFWTPGGDGEWMVDKEIVSFGESSITFDGISGGQRTWIETSVTGPGTLTFRWKVSSESCDQKLCDYGQFSLNGEAWQTIAGEVDWQSVVLTLPLGEHQLRWDYIKDEFTTAGEDKLWLDGVAFGQGYPVPVKIVGDGRVSLAPDRLLYENGDQILLQATPEAPQRFQAWRDPIWSAETELLYTVNGFLTLTAQFGDDYQGALDLWNQVWVSEGDVPWIVVDDPLAVGGAAVRSGDVGDEQSSVIGTRLVGPGVLRFRWKVSSELCPDDPCDFMFVSVNGNQVRSIAGETAWEEVTLNLPSGEHAVQWGYQKDVFTTAGEDAGWLDHVRYEPRQVERAPISGMEYFVDEDPGEGNGIPLAIDQEEFVLPMEGLLPGLHLITVRAREERDGEVVWSHHNTVPFTIRGVDEDQQLTSLEYFFDDDPGAGGRVPLSPAAYEIEIPVDGLPLGAHRLEFRIAETFRGDLRESSSVNWPIAVVPNDMGPGKALTEIRFQFLTSEGQLTPPMIVSVQGETVFDGSVDVLSDLLRNPGVLLGRAIAINIAGEESSAAWFEVEVDGDFTSPWQNWVSHHFSMDQQNDATVSGPDSDPDGDGLPNLLELATGGDPLTPDRGAGLVSLSRGDDGTLELHARALKRDLPSVAVPYESQGLLYEVEAASDDFNWEVEALSLIAEPSEVDEIVSELIFRVPSDSEEVPLRFFRLKVSPTASFQF